MKIPLIIALASSLFVGGTLDFDKNNKNQYDLNLGLEKNISKFNTRFLDSMECYVDGATKVQFNQLEDTNLIIDSWDYNETKQININANLLELDANSKFLEIEIPKGLQLMSTPESLINNSLVSVDASAFKTTSYDIESGNTSKKVYTPNNGVLRYKINPAVTGINLDILVAIDDFLWDGKSSNATPTDNDKIKITIGDKDNSRTLKLDRINVNTLHYSPWYWSGSENAYLTQDLDKEYSETILFTDQPRLFKNVTMKMEKPYIERLTPDGTVKEYLPIKDIKSDQGGTFTETLDSVIFTWNNVYQDRLDMKFVLNASKDLSNHKDEVIINFKGGRFTRMLNDTEYIIDKQKTITSTVISNEAEYIVFSGQSHGAYKSGIDSNILYNFGRLDLKNEGAPSNRKKLSMEFPIEGIGVKTVRLPAPKEAKSYQLKISLWNKDTQDIVDTTINIDKEYTSEEIFGYLLTVIDVLNLSNLKIDNPSDMYFKSISYEIGVLPSKYSSGSLEPWHTSDSGNIYGEVFSDAEEIDHKIKYTLTDLDDSNAEPLVTYSSTSIKSETYVTTRIGGFKLLDNDDKSISEIMAGENIRLKGNLYVPSYAYNYSVHMTNPIFYLKVPKQLKINEQNSSIDYISSGTRKKLDFSIPNKDNPRTTSDGMFVYEIHPILNGDIIGFYKENLDEFGSLDFCISLEIPKSTRSITLNIGETLLIGDKLLKTGDSSDKWDVDGDGNTSESFVSTGNLPLSIISNTEWLDTDYSTGNSTSTGSKDHRPIFDSNDIISYSLIVNNSNEGYVRTGNMEYYIPIPKKNLEYNENIKNSSETFNFDMVLSEKVDLIDGFNILYSYNNVNFFEYSKDIDLSKVSMVKFINNRDIVPDEKLEFGAKMKYLEGSWDGSDNDNIWSMYGHQTYEKNGLESSYLHVLDKFKVELIFEPKIVKNPSNVSVDVGGDIYFTTEVDVGIPVATGNWQYRTSSTGSWTDLSETSTTLSLHNVSYSMNDYEYRYVATNKRSTVESLPAVLTVMDRTAPTIDLREFKEDGVYKIEITASDSGSGVSHIILPDGTRINSNTHTITVKANTNYTFKAYDLAGNESIKSTMISVLESKSASSNLDVYIKSENMLSISLDTNSITFDDFSGTEDIEKQNVINMTVSSSLPYQINVYMPTEIQNADKSKTMDKSILNIKVNGESTYKTFNDTVSHILLLDNQMEGNGIVHSVDLKLKGNIAHKKDVYKTTIRFEVKQK